jgi:hypothetical protein
LSHSLVLAKDEPFPVSELGPGMAKIIGRATADVTRALRACRGIISLDLSRAEAERIAGFLSRSGREARVVSEDLLPVLPPPAVVLDADLAEEGLLVRRTAPDGTGGHLPWERLHIVCAASVTYRSGPSPTLSDPELGGIGDRAGKLGAIAQVVSGFTLDDFPGQGNRPRSLGDEMRKEARREKATTVRCLDLVARNPLEHYRIDAGRFDYRCLGDRMKLTSVENFHELILDMAERAPEALLTGSTLSLLEDPSGRAHHFGSGAVYGAYLRWVVAWTTVWER